MALPLVHPHPRHRRAILEDARRSLPSSASMLLSGIQVNNYLLEDLAGRRSPCEQEFNFFEHEFSGVRPQGIGPALRAGTGCHGRARRPRRRGQSWKRGSPKTVGAGSRAWGPLPSARTAHRLMDGDRPSANRIPDGLSSERLLIDRPQKLDRKAADGVRRMEQHGAGRSGPCAHHRQDCGPRRQGPRRTQCGFLDRVDAFLEDHFERRPSPSRSPARPTSST